MRTIHNLDCGWRFRRGDIDQLKTPNGLIHWRPRMHLTKSGWCHPPSMPDFDDADWRALDLPHDWAVEGLPDPDPAVDCRLPTACCASGRRAARVCSASTTATLPSSTPSRPTVSVSSTASPWRWSLTTGATAPELCVETDGLAAARIGIAQGDLDTSGKIQKVL